MESATKLKLDNDVVQMMLQWLRDKDYKEAAATYVYLPRLIPR